MAKKYDLDLDALSGKYKKVRFNSRIIEVKQPDLKTFLEIMELSTLVGSGDDEAENAIEALNKLIKVVHSLAPDLRGAEINTEQLFALVELIGSMVKPDDVKELQDKGVSFNVEGQKKTNSESVEK